MLDQYRSRLAGCATGKESCDDDPMIINVLQKSHLLASLDSWIAELSKAELSRSEATP